MAMIAGRAYGIAAAVLVGCAVFAAQWVSIVNLKTSVANGATALEAEKGARQSELAVSAMAAASAIDRLKTDAETQRAAAQKVIDDERTKNQALAADRDRLRAAVAGMSDAARAAAAAARRDCRSPDQPGPSSSEPASDPAGVLADVLGECTAAYSGMAETADRRGLAGVTSWRERATLITPE